MKVRIGNDICLRVTLLGGKNSDYINIKSIRAYLINTSRLQDIDDQHRRDSIMYRNEIEDREGVIKYISRFPAEPRSRAYRGTPYDLMHCGHPTFHVHPVYCVAPYIGFGVHPHTFDPFHNHLWAYDDMKDLHDDMLLKEKGYKDLYSLCEFMAPVSAMEESNKVEVYFPAESQLYTGVYKLVIVAKVYEPGYASNNLRTVTMDYNEVFELVRSSDQAGETGNVYISVGNLKEATSIYLSGITTIGLTWAPSTIYSVIYPMDIDNNKVVWEIPNPDDRKYLGIVSTDKTECKISAIALPEGEDAYVATLRATSDKTPSVYKDIKITIVRNVTGDIYTENGSIGNNKLNLNLTNGQVVDIDTSSETAWYEGN